MTETVMISGGFDPVHIGHVQLIRSAKTHGDVVVALNSDDWLVRKKGFCFQSFDERRAILEEMGCRVMAVCDNDGTVLEALKRIKPDYFANGGDRVGNNTPEVTYCANNGIKLLWNVGGGKIGSSSTIATRSRVERSWGSYITLHEDGLHKVKMLSLLPGKALSHQRHFKRSEVWVFPDGSAVQVKEGEWHQLSNPTPEVMNVIEVQTGSYFGEDDIERK